jgi:hypothetical protein
LSGFESANPVMLVPMALKTCTGDLELRAALLDPPGRPSTVLRNEALNITNTLPLRDDAGIGQHCAAERDTGVFLPSSPHASF